MKYETFDLVSLPHCVPELLREMCQGGLFFGGFSVIPITRILKGSHDQMQNDKECLTVGQCNYFTTSVTVLYELPLVAVLSPLIMINNNIFSASNW